MKLINLLFQILFFSFIFFYSNTIKAQSATPCEDGMAGEYPCSNIDMSAHIPLAFLNMGNGNDIWGWTSPSSGREFAIVGARAGTIFVDISDPIKPVMLGRLASAADNSLWRDIKVVNNIAYIGSEALDHQLQTFNLFRLDGIVNPFNPLILEADGSGFISGDTDPGGNSHNVVGNSDSRILATVGTRSICNGGIVLYDVKSSASDILNPSQSGCFGDDDYSHDAVCFTYRGSDLEHVGKDICIGLNVDTYTIVDVSNPASPVQLSRMGYPKSAYTHQGWITDDHQYLIVNDELDEGRNEENTRTLVFRIADLDAPDPEPHQIFYHDTPSIDHNLYVRGSYVYQANYRAGLRILDISDLDNKNITEAAFFDIYPEDDGLGYQGSWSVYPYYDSDKVVVNGITNGLFVLEPKLPHFFIKKPQNGLRYGRAGETVSYPLDIIGYGGLDDDISIAVSGEPVDPMNTANPPSFTVSPHTGQSTVLEIEIPTGTPDGTYSILLEGTADNLDSPPHRLVLGLIVASTLPFSLTDFTGKEQKVSNVLQWSTIDEVTTSKHIIQRSMNGENEWKSIGEILVSSTGGELNQYEWFDYSPLLTSYYRLCTKDQDGNSSYSPIVLVHRMEGETMRVYPNPAKDFILLQYNSDFNEQSILQLVDPLGKEVLRLDWDITEGMNYQEVFLQHLPNGIYYLNLNGKTLEKILKN